MAVNLKKLSEADKIIQDIAKELGLDFFPQEFDVIPAQKMFEIMAYRFPVNFSHWSFGRDYEKQRTGYDYGQGVPYEVVFNSNPSRAYLMNTNPLSIQILVIAHVYAHNDFMKNNLHFQPSRRDMIPSASDAAERFRKYEEDYGQEEVEKIIDAGMAIEFNIDPDFWIKKETREEQRYRLYGSKELPLIQDPFGDIFSKKIKERPPKSIIDQKTPLEPTRDLLLYIIENAPLAEWQKDVLSVIREQALYFMPNIRTKIMNEGWATYWHMKIMEELFRRKYLSAEDHGYYNLYNSRVIASSKVSLNPYLVGLKMWHDIEDRWNKGKFGREYEGCEDLQKKMDWDTNTGIGRQKIFEVRKTYSDRFFLEHFLTEKLVDDLDLYIYKKVEYEDRIEYVIAEKDWKVIKNILVRSKSGFGPYIEVVDGNYQRNKELMLIHRHEGLDLDEEYREKTMEQIYALWQKTLYMESKITTGFDTNQKVENVIFTYDGKEHNILD